MVPPVLENPGKVLEFDSWFLKFKKFVKIVIAKCQNIEAEQLNK